MLKMTADIPLKRFMEEPVTAQVLPYLIGNGDELFEIPGITLHEIQERQNSWNAEDMAYGLNRLLEVASTEKKYVYSIYTAEEIHEKPARSSGQIIWFPRKKKAAFFEKSFVIVIAGGGYDAVCSIAEAFPAAARLNDLGITSFVLNYQVHTKSMVPGEKLFPEPMRDLAHAYRMIADHSAQFAVDPLSYSAIRFSEGVHRAAFCGPAHAGARSYHLPQPKALFCAYPFLTFDHMEEICSEAYVKAQKISMLGSGDADFSEYSVNQHIDKNYPPTYLVHCEDDNLVPFADSLHFRDVLQSHKIPCRMERYKSGGHGFGLGDHTSASGWIERAVSAWESFQVDL